MNPRMADRYLSRLDALYGRLNYERSGMPRSSDLRLGRMRRFLRHLGDPHRNLRIIHVAGTKGKGSTATLIAAALSGSGVRTGLFTSPHLHRLEERFQIDGRPIEPDALSDLIDVIWPAVQAMDDLDADPSPRRPLTFFEITTAMGLVHFARQKTGAVVLEVGLGGRLDSTNVVRPLVSVITSISYDHTRQLGNTLSAIASEKAGILKRQGVAVSGVAGLDARAAIQSVAKQRQVRLHALGVDFQTRYQAPSFPVATPTPGTLEVQTWRRHWGPLSVPLLGSHQARNAAVALATLDALADQEPSLNLDEPTVAHAWRSLSIPARVELLPGSPNLLLIDGAHNNASARALADTLLTHFPPSRRLLIFGTTRDKDLLGQLRWLRPLFHVFIATRYRENPRAVMPEEITAAASELGFPSIHATDSPAEALQLARQLAQPPDSICVTGSLFLAAETRALALGLPPVPRPTAVGV